MCYNPCKEPKLLDTGKHSDVTNVSFNINLHYYHLQVENQSPNIYRFWQQYLKSSSHQSRSGLHLHFNKGGIVCSQKLDLYKIKKKVDKILKEIKFIGMSISFLYLRQS